MSKDPDAPPTPAVGELLPRAVEAYEVRVK